MKASDLYVEFGLRVRISREIRGLTQSELAEAIGLTRTSVVNIEAGRQKVLLCTLIELSKSLGVPVQNLVPTERRGRKRK